MNPQNTTQNTTQGPAQDAASALLAVWVARTRSAGHPVIAAGPGRFRPRPIPVPVSGMPINDVIDAERERQRAKVAWVHAVLPTSAALLALGDAVRAPIPAPVPRGLWPRPRRAGAGAGVTPVGPVAVSDTLDGVTTHVLELPVSWLTRPVTVIRRHPSKPAPPAQTGSRASARVPGQTAGQVPIDGAGRAGPGAVVTG